MRLKNKVAIITGAGTGIGKAIAVEFAKQGAKVVIAGIIDKPCKETVAEIKKFKGEAIFVKTDVSKAKDVEKLVKTCVQKFKKLDILVNNAGIVRFGPLHEMSEKDWDAVINVDLKGVFLGMKYAIPYMLKNKKGKIINIASIAGLVGFDAISAYCAAKGAVINLTKEAALEYAPHKINVNCIAPGIIRTPMTQDMLNDKKTVAGFHASTPYPRLGVPEDIANGAIYLASDESDFVNGETLVIDGGWVAR